MLEGWILLHRKLQECEIWSNSQPFDMRSAWVDLLLLANHRDVEIIFDYEPMTVKRGQYLTSVRKLSSRWNWSKDRTLKYLRMLERLGMIHRESTNQRTLITIDNYDIYQDMQDTDTDTDVDTGKDTPQTQDGHDTDTGSPQTNNDNNDNNINNILSENFSSETAKEIIEYLNVVLGSRYTTKNKNLVSMINARLAEGHTVDDFKVVINKKNKQWRNDPKMVGYLRPETLFCAKHFESYLNEKVVDNPQPQPKKNANAGIQTHGYDFAELENMAFGKGE